MQQQAFSCYKLCYCQKRNKNVKRIYIYIYIYGQKKVAQHLVGHNFKTARKNSTKLHTTFFQHVFNHYVNFQSKWTTNVEMTVVLRLGAEKSNIVDTSNIVCVCHALCSVRYSAEMKKCQVCLWCQIAITIT